MQGLSQAADQIIDIFSKLDILEGYQLIGGTALAIQINHRLSEDLDFCRWVKPGGQDAVAAKYIHAALQAQFGEVEMQHLSFAQANYVIQNPVVKVTFYHTTLRNPGMAPLPLLNNIQMSPIEVLGGSKMYVITQRSQLRDYYDLLVLRNEGHQTVEQMVKAARTISREANPKKLLRLFGDFNFDRFAMADVEKLNPKFPYTPEDYKKHCSEIAEEIYKGFLQHINKNARVEKTQEELTGKIDGANNALNALIAHGKGALGLTDAVIKDLMERGPNTVHYQRNSVAGMSPEELKAELKMINSCVKNLISSVKHDHGLVNKQITSIIRGSAY